MSGLSAHVATNIETRRAFAARSITDDQGYHLQGEFSPESGLNGISFNYRFSNVGQGDQLVISADTGLFFAYKVYYVMTGTVAGKGSGVGTLSLTSIAGSFFNHDIKIQLMPLAGSHGASATISNLQEFTTS
jgi:hypothetical protein